MGNTQGGGPSSSLKDTVYPNRALWEREYQGSPQYQTREMPIEHSPTWNRDTHVRLVCISDTHSVLTPDAGDDYSKSLPDGDILVHAGDFTKIGKKEEIQQFARWLGRQKKYPHKVVIAGNHDLTLDPSTSGRRAGYTMETAPNPEELKEMLRKHCTLLEDEATTACGLKFYGCPWSPEYGTDWGFNLPRNSEEIRQRWAAAPDDTDVLVTHGPPLGILDLCRRGERAGCRHLLEEVACRIKPRLHVFGHIHEGYGKCTNGETVFVNASTVDLFYTPVNRPVVVDLPKVKA